MRYKLVIILLLAVTAAGLAAYGFYHRQSAVFSSQSGRQDFDGDTALDADENDPPASPVPVTEADFKEIPADKSALGNYNVLIADRGNNRLLVVTPEKKIIWQYQYNLPKKGLGADDSFFVDGGKAIITNLEEYHVIEKLDYQTKQVIWSYGVPGKPGSASGYLNTPDDAYQLPNGNITVADIKNCRVLEIRPDKSIARQYGVTGKCSNQPGYLDSPNGDTPLPNGHTLISNIRSRNMIELDQNWQPVFTMPLPVRYPSDPQLTKAGNILISDYSNPGQVVEVSKSGQVVWRAGVPLNKPSLAIELPNGNIMATDDYNHRVIVIDKQTGKIVWQYGVTGKPGVADGQLNVPDGLDIIPAVPSVTYTVGQVSRHAIDFVNQNVSIAGYVLRQENGYAIISDEASGSLGPYDLPIRGVGVSGLAVGKKYTFVGTLTQGGLDAVNHNSFHLELSAPAQN
ncbi:MAG: PQQ-binding-like beta-propeller repeat protein [Patescibacteria group bacterium]|nr:PQQ-binding-like beta-propeller repeat protein [Patescibacteria group bacterium]